MPRRLPYILLFCMLSLSLWAQSVDSSSRQDTSKIVDIYYQSLGEQSPLYNGSQYIEYPFIIQDGHPFFGSQGFVDATIRFEGMTFDQVPALYDIVRDQLVILDYHRYYKINLPADKIQQFELPGHTFIRLLHDSSNEIKTGFYEQLYHGINHLNIADSLQIWIICNIFIATFTVIPSGIRLYLVMHSFTDCMNQPT